MNATRCEYVEDERCTKPATSVVSYDEGERVTCALCELHAAFAYQELNDVRLVSRIR